MRGFSFKLICGKIRKKSLIEENYMSTLREKREMENKIKLDNIQQLHNAVLQFSNNTMEIKKLLVSVLIAFFTIVVAIDNKFETFADFHIIILSVIIILFWLLDAQSYYYQKKLRSRISKLQSELSESVKYEEVKTCKLVIISIFNVSMFIYWVALGIVLLLRVMVLK